MQKQTEIYMRQNHMARPGDGVLVGLSGGADSVGLLLVLWKLRETFQISLRALHVHHGLRGAEADRDAAFSRMLCERLEVPFYEFRIDAAKEALDRKCSVEEAGRQARYRLYEETALAWEKEMCPDLTSENAGGKEAVAARVHIATAHHADDNAETVLFNLFRGSGLTGLSGIAPVRGRIIRPLLWAQRSEIQTWLRQQGQDWVEDSTNQESEYSRNWLRNELLPAVEERLNAQAVRHIDQAGRRIRQADAYLEEVAEEWLQKHAPDGKADAGALAEQAEIVQGYIVRRLFLKSKMPLRDVTETHVQAVRELLYQGTGKSISLPHGFRAVNIYGFLEVRPLSHPGERKGGLLPGIQNENLLQMHTFPCENGDEFPKNQYTKWFDYDKINVGLSIRYRKNGDYLTLSGGGKKKLRRYMIDEKIPENERDRIPVLADGDHVLWVVGYRISDYYKITDETEHILEAEVILPGGGEPEGSRQAGIWNCKGEDHG